ncbi:MAG: Hpt domain-containing protein [Gammaproteobacteria bacterium]|nr:Hpt domain-containing protein [Gammaproteobacteria bacterium]
MEIDISQFHQSFFEESLEMLADMEKALLNIDVNQPTDKEAVNRIFRAMHSMKGGSATFGFNIIRDFTHTLESYLTQIRNGSQSLTKESVDLMLKAVDCLRDLIADLSQNSLSL